MKNAIFYFTGTGNSLDAATRIAATLDDCELIDIASWKGDETSDAERIGFAFPLYYLGLPAIVHEFFRKVKLPVSAYLFAVVTMGDPLPGVSFAQVEGYLRAKGRELDAGFALIMPGNYIILYDVPSEAQTAEILKRAHSSADEIAAAVAKKERVKAPRVGILSKAVSRGANFYFVHTARKSDRKFTVSPACVGCGKCALACGVGNVSIEGGKPAWNHRCEQCLACVHSCPVRATDYGKATANRGRYLNPNVSVARDARPTSDPSIRR